MKFNEIIEGLYSSDFDRNLHIINQSIYVMDTSDMENDKIFHTGIIFKEHKGKDFELLFNDTKEILIRQIRFEDSIPCLAGLLCYYFGKSIRSYFTNETINEMCNIKLIFYKENESNIQVYNLKRKYLKELMKYHKNIIIKLLLKFSLSKKIKPLLFFKGRYFEKYISHEEWIRIQYEKEEKEAEAYRDMKQAQEDFEDEFGDIFSLWDT